MKIRSPRICVAIAACTMLGTSAGALGVFPTPGTPAPEDVGALSAQDGAAQMTVTLHLKLRDQAAAEHELQALSDKTSPTYHQFLTPQEFRTRFGQSDENVAMVASYLAVYGLSTERAGASTLRVTGAVADIQRAFQVSLHRYEVPAQADASAVRFQAPA